MTRGSDSRATRADVTQDDAVRDAFRELHGRRLHGFALLLTLGDRSLAARLTADALGSGMNEANGLRHPERAAAWLRARLLDGMPRRHRRPSPAEERAGLDPLGVDRAVVDGLAAIGPRERAALVAIDVERLDERDAATIVGRHGAALERLLTRARARYLDACASVPAPSARGPRGSTVRRIRAVAARTMT